MRLFICGAVMVSLNCQTPIKMIVTDAKTQKIQILDSMCNDTQETTFSKT